MKALFLAAALAASTAHAGVIYTHSSDGETVDLYDEQAHCKSGALLVTYTKTDKSIERGCWKIQAGRVLIRWDDGDFGIIPPDAFRKVIAS